MESKLREQGFEWAAMQQQAFGAASPPYAFNYNAAAAAYHGQVQAAQAAQAAALTQQHAQDAAAFYKQQQAAGQYHALHGHASHLAHVQRVEAKLRAGVSGGEKIDSSPAGADSGPTSGVFPPLEAIMSDDAILDPNPQPPSDLMRYISKAHSGQNESTVAQKRKIDKYILGITKELEALTCENSVLRDHVARSKDFDKPLGPGSEQKSMEDKYWISSEQEKKILRLETDKSELVKKLKTMKQENEKLLVENQKLNGMLQNNPPTANNQTQSQIVVPSRSHQAALGQAAAKAKNTQTFDKGNIGLSNAPTTCDEDPASPKSPESRTSSASAADGKESKTKPVPPTFMPPPPPLRKTTEQTSLQDLRLSMSNMDLTRGLSLGESKRESVAVVNDDSPTKRSPPGLMPPPLSNSPSEDGSSLPKTPNRERKGSRDTDSNPSTDSLSIGTGTTAAVRAQALLGGSGTATPSSMIISKPKTGIETASDRDDASQTSWATVLRKFKTNNNAHPLGNSMPPLLVTSETERRLQNLAQGVRTPNRLGGSVPAQFGTDPSPFSVSPRSLNSSRANSGVYNALSRGPESVDAMEMLRELDRARGRTDRAGYPVASVGSGLYSSLSQSVNTHSTIGLQSHSQGQTYAGISGRSTTAGGLSGTGGGALAESFPAPTNEQIEQREEMLKLCTELEVEQRTRDWFAHPRYAGLWKLMVEKTQELKRRTTGAEPVTGVSSDGSQRVLKKVKNPSAWLTRFFNIIRVDPEDPKKRETQLSQNSRS